MQLATPSVTAFQVLEAFRRDAPYLFLGAAFMAVGGVAAAFAAIRRSREPLLIHFALFAALYGARLWIQATVLGLIMEGSAFYARLTTGINYVILIPALLFFTSLGLLSTQLDQFIAYILMGTGVTLTALTFIVGPSPWYGTVNNAVVIAALLIMAVNVARRGPATVAGTTRSEFWAIRWGLLIFVIAALWDNMTALASVRSPRLEPFGFLAFLTSLGYVATWHSLHRDQQLQRVQDELEIAREIQLSIVPTTFPNSSAFRVAARYEPVTAVAGDFYDYVLADDHQAGLLIADVSGHGVPAALIASMVKLAAASQRKVAADPSRFLAGVNSALLGNTQSRYVTAAYLYLNVDSQEFRYSAAGHPSLLLLRQGRVLDIQENGLMLGIFDFASYTNCVQPLERGDRFLLYTDGLPEATDQAGHAYGQDALRSALIKTAAFSPSEAANTIISSVRQWSAKQDDDLTLVICDYVTNSLRRA